jgi:superoxide dismutase, Fe-Mn family
LLSYPQLSTTSIATNLIIFFGTGLLTLVTPPPSTFFHLTIDDYGALEPSISGKIMELHHKGHHNAYVTNYNSATEQLGAATSSGNVQSQIALQAAINCNGGGHVNHSLFWENLAPRSQGGGDPPAGRLARAIDSVYGDYERFRQLFSAALAGIQGSGWAWLVKEKATGAISIRTYANQDPVVGAFEPLLGIDAWEHAY